MEKVEFFSPDNIPAEVLVYDSKPKQLGVGAAGKLGFLSLELASDKQTGQTKIKSLKSCVPLLAQRALYYETELPSMAYIQIISPSGGILQGDRYRIDVSLKDGAISHITTQGATRLYKMNANFATQQLNLTVDENCYLEFIPEQIIPYKDSRFYQTVTLNVHDNATAIYSEIITSGRVAMKESFEYDVCYLKTVSKNQQGKLRFVDTLILEPKKRRLDILGVLGENSVVGTVYIVTKRRISELCDEINSIIQSKASGGASILPYDAGVMARLTSGSSSDIKDTIYDIVKLTRKKILNAPFTGIRKN